MTNTKQFNEIESLTVRLCVIAGKSATKLVQALEDRRAASGGGVPVHFDWNSKSLFLYADIGGSRGLWMRLHSPTLVSIHAPPADAYHILGACLPAIHRRKYASVASVLEPLLHDELKRCPWTTDPFI